LTLISQTLLFTCNVEPSLSSAAPWSGLDPVGLALGFLSVLAFSAFGVLNRVVVDKDWGACLKIGLWEDHTCFFAQSSFFICTGGGWLVSFWYTQLALISAVNFCY
jgi:hypothetical protein